MYVLRDKDGQIYCVFANQQEFATEYLHPDNPELVAWLAAHDPRGGAVTC